jgi:hypothetical protein
LPRRIGLSLRLGLSRRASQWCLAPLEVAFTLHLKVMRLRESCMRDNRTCSLGGGRRPARKRASSDPTIIYGAVSSELAVIRPPLAAAIDQLPQGSNPPTLYTR